VRGPLPLVPPARGTRARSRLGQADLQRLAVDGDGAAEPTDEPHRDRRAEVAQVLAEDDRGGGGSDAREPDLGAVHLDVDIVEAAVTERRLEERRQPA